MENTPLKDKIAAALISEMLMIEELSSPVEEYRSRSILDGREVIATDGEVSFDCRVVGVDEDFSLLIERATDGSRLRLFTGEVSIKIK